MRDGGREKRTQLGRMRSIFAAPGHHSRYHGQLLRHGQLKQRCDQRSDNLYVEVIRMKNGWKQKKKTRLGRVR